jgi:hypothetical protein
MWNATTISAVLTVGLLLIAAIAGAGRALYKRGKEEQSLTSSIDRLDQTGQRQADAAVELAGQVGALRVTLERHSETLVEHHWRLRALEDKTAEAGVH